MKKDETWHNFFSETNMFHLQEMRVGMNLNLDDPVDGSEIR